MFTVAIALVLNSIKGTANARCDDIYNITMSNSSGLGTMELETLEKLKECKSEGWSNWYYVIFLTPILTLTGIGIWHLSKPF